MIHTHQIEVPIGPGAVNLGDDVIHVVGRIVRWWANVEFTVDSSIRDLLNRGDTRQIKSEALILPMKQRFNILCDLLSDVARDKGDLEKLKQLIHTLSSLQNYRDFVVHGLLVTDAKRPATHVYTSRIRWSNPTKVRRTFLRKEKLLDIERKIFRTQMKLFMATAGCHHPSWRPSLDIGP